MQHVARSYSKVVDFAAEISKSPKPENMPVRNGCFAAVGAVVQNNLTNFAF